MIMLEYFFLVLLILVSYVTYREKKRFFRSCRESYGKLMVGISSWLLLVLLRLLSKGNLLQTVPVLNQGEYRIVAEALLLVSGALFLVSGIAQWVRHVSDTDAVATTLRRHLDFLSAVAQAAANGQDVDGLIADLRRLTAHFTEATAVNFYRRSHQSGKLVQTGGESAPLPERVTELEGYLSAESSSGAALFPAGDTSERKASCIVPFRWKSAERVLMVIDWNDGVKVDASLMQVLNLAAVCLNSSEPGQRQDESGKRAFLSIANRLQNELAGAERIQNQMQKISMILNEAIPHDILRIAVFDAGGHNVTQYCLGQGRNLMTERNKSISTHKTQLGELFRTHSIAYCDSLESSQFEDDRWLAGCGAKVALTIPVLSGDKMLAALTLASERPTMSKDTALAISSEISVALLPLVKSDILTHQLVGYNRQILDLTSVVRKMALNDDPRGFLSELAETMVRKLPATYCRFWQYDNNRDMLEFMADAQVRDISRQVTDVKRLPLSSTRWHKLALQDGRMMLVNQREERMRMDDQEMLLSLAAGTQSALIIPMVSRNQPVGVMAVAEMRNWDRRNFSLADTLFARAIAGIATEALASLRLSQNLEQLNRRLSQLEKERMVAEVFADLPMRMATPLSSIMARTQQVIETQPNPDDVTARNLRIIQRQTEKLIKEVRAIQELRREQSTPQPAALP